LSLKDKILKNTTLENTRMLEDSIVFEPKDLIQSDVSVLNIAGMGSLDGGIPPGILTIAGKSKHFKTKFAVEIADKFLEKYEDGIVLFYDSEFGTPKTYFDQFHYRDRVVHSPLYDLEDLTNDIMTQLVGQVNDKGKLKEVGIIEGDHVLILLDSLGNLASKKEIGDALSGNEAADMTRAKKVKSLFRMIRPHIYIKNIPMIIINHTYETMDKFSKEVVSGGTGGIYNSDIIWIISKRAIREGTETVGSDFTIHIEKSRYVQEKSTIEISVTYEDGILPWSGLLDLAKESGIVTVAGAWCTNTKTGAKFQGKDTQNMEFWQPFLVDEEFKQFIVNKYKLKG
jgi:RecA/RadA recombinase